MNKNLVLKVIFDSIYAVGCAMFLVLIGLYLFGSAEPINQQDAMIPLSIRSYAWTGICVGTLPMLGSALAVYFSNRLHLSNHKFLYLLLLLIPAIVCLVFLLMFLVPFMFAMFKTSTRAYF
ncbi:MAG: hypothetical protein LBM65_01780 [Oscillospiraceae bacterium]|jgi:bacteriorhodopsin|nr:hypothetical protein [Oscillospiraceae bacterium]